MERWHSWMAASRARRCFLIKLVTEKKWKNYKSMDRYDFFKSCSVRKELQFKNRKNSPVTKMNLDSHNKWVLCEMVGSILIGGYSCMVENSKTCSHVGVNLFTGACGVSFRPPAHLPHPPSLFVSILEHFFFKKTSLHIWFVQCRIFFIKNRFE